jgi:hypothetical protein
LTRVSINLHKKLFPKEDGWPVKPDYPARLRASAALTKAR